MEDKLLNSVNKLLKVNAKARMVVDAPLPKRTTR